ncbi:MAG: amidase [Flavobacteriaceae bacterium]|nr:amidase [Flavobacteriaceae bacterium]
MKKIHLITLLLSILILSCTNLKKENSTILLDELTISQIHTAYQNGEYTAVQLINAYFDRIDSLDNKTNAITYINKEALITAKKLDEEFAKTRKLRPLHGIPLIVKDNYNTKGMPTTAGALALQNFIPETNAFVVQQLIDAGAIIIAKSNMAEWAFSAKHTESSTAGTTHNPYNLDYVPAGSSGGTGAGIAANFGTIGLGTDTGNSIRGPSSHNALVGFRTTLGLVSRSGIIPLYMRNDVAGPMCRTVEDATRVLEVIAGYDSNDQMTNYNKGKVNSNYQQYLDLDGLKKARIGVLRQLSDANPDIEIKTLFEKSIVDLQHLGATVVDVYVQDFDSLKTNQWCANFRQDIENYLAEYVKRDTIKTLEDIIRIGTKSEYAKKALNYFSENSGRKKDTIIACEDPYTDVRRLAFRKAIEDQMDKLELDAIIYPSWNNKPAHINKFEEEYLGDNNQIIAPHTGQPAFTVPMGFTSEGLPTGLQFLGRMYSEPTLIRLAYSYEQGTKHRKGPQFKSK